MRTVFWSLVRVVLVGVGVVFFFVVCGIANSETYLWLHDRIERNGRVGSAIGFGILLISVKLATWVYGKAVGLYLPEGEWQAPWVGPGVRRVVLSKWTAVVPLALAVVMMVLGVCLVGTSHEVRVGRVTVVQFGGRFAVQDDVSVLVGATRMWVVATALAVPGVAWGVWWGFRRVRRRS